MPRAIQFDPTASFTTNSIQEATNTSAVSLYLPFDSNINDASANAHTVTATGGAGISSAQSKFGSNSALFDGSDDYLSVAANSDFIFGADNFTIELFVYPNNNNNYMLLAHRASSATGLFTLEMNRNTTGDIEFFAGDYSGSSPLLSTTISGGFSGAFHHIAITRSGNVFSLFFDGVLKNSATQSVTFSNITAELRIGADNHPTIGSRFFFSGYVDDVRIIKSVALYTQNFVPPSQAVGASLSGTNETNSGSTLTSLYLPLNSDVNDDSSNNHTITALGGAVISSAQSKFGGSSVYLDGGVNNANGSRLRVSSDVYDQFYLSDFTIEMFIYPTTIKAARLWSQWEGTRPLLLQIQSDGDLQVLVNNSSRLETTGGVTANSWFHIALVRIGETFTLFIDGVNKGRFEVTGNLNSYSDDAYIGARYSGAAGFEGYIDDVRIVRFGIYTDDFTPPTSALTTSISQTRNDLAVLYMPFDDGLADKARNHAVLPYGNIAISATQAKFGGKSLFIDATGDYLTVESNGDFKFGTNDFSISMFIRPDTINTAASAGAFAAILDYDASTLNGAHFTLHQKNQGLVWVVQSAIALTTSDCLTANTWHHVAVVRSSGTTSIIVDGTSVGSFSDSQNYTDTTTRKLYIGKQNITNTRRFDGYIDDLLIVNGFAMNFPAAPTAASGGEVLGTTTDTRTFSSVWNLNSPEVAEAFKAGTWPGPLIDTQYTKLYMSFDTNVQDESPSTRSVTASGNAAVSTTQAKFGKSLYLDGSGDYLTVPHASDFNFAGSDFTIEAWVYNTSFPSGSGAVISKWTGSSKEFVVFTIAAGLYFYWSHNGSTNNYIQSTDGLSLNTWHHIAITSSSNVGRLFVDGALQSATANFSSLPIYQSTTPVLIGARDGGSVSNFAGYIDHLMVLKGHARYTSSFTAPTAASGGGI